MVAKTEAKDCTFIRMALEAVYKDQPDAYRARSITGRSHTNDKRPASPEKILAVTTEFESRIAKLNLEASEYEKRCNSLRIRKLINDGFQNLSRKYSQN